MWLLLRLRMYGNYTQLVCSTAETLNLLIDNVNVIVQDLEVAPMRKLNNLDNNVAFNHRGK